MELYDVFISYRRSDGLKTAKALYDYLTARGLRVFWDIKKMEHGKAFPLQLTQNIQNAPTYVLVVTEDVFKFRPETADEKDYVREEIRTALAAAEGHEDERPLCILDPVDGYFPDAKDLPEDVRPISKVHRIPVEKNLASAFEQVFQLATRVTRSNLWNAAHRAYTGSRTNTGRFARLNICQGILPGIDREHRQSDIPIYTSIQFESDRRENNLPLLDAITRTKEHLYLIGQGGIGKTTALMHIMGSTYENGTYTPGEMIPLFVELSFAPDTYGPLYATQVASFIRRSIYGMLRADLQARQDKARGDHTEEVFSLPEDVAVNPIDDLFRRQTDKPEFLLLLDGLNEVSTVELENGRTVMEMVTGEIDYLMRRCPNVRIILTSRSNDTDIGGNTVTRLYLQGVEQDSISEYLMLQGFSEQRIQAALSDENLRKSLEIPLFLTMYASISEENTATAQGEILHIFFHERSRNLSLYTNQDRLQSLEENAGHAGRTIQNSRITAQMFRFMLDFVLPELGWYMERSGLFYLSDTQAQQLITGLLTGTGAADVLGPAGKVVFSQYRKSGSRRHHVQKCAADLRQVLGFDDPNDMVSITDSILTCCMTTLGILQDIGGHCVFVHQHIRDYFAAVKIINTMRIALYLQEQNQSQAAISSLTSVLNEAPLGITVRRFLGESLGEHKNKPLFMHGTYCSAVPDEECDRNLLERLLNIYRDRFDGLDGYSLHSLLKILTEVRGSLAGCDLSRLDLTGCDLSGSKIGLSGLSANVSGAKFSGKELFFGGHKNNIVSLDYSADGKYILSASHDGKVCVTDLTTGVVCRRVNAPAPLQFAAFTQGNTGFITVSSQNVQNHYDQDNHSFTYDFNCVVLLWDGESCVRRTAFRQDRKTPLASILLTSDRSHLLLWGWNHIHILSASLLQTNHSIKFPPHLILRNLSIYDTENLLCICELAAPHRGKPLQLLLNLSTFRYSEAPQELQQLPIKAFACHHGVRFAVISDGDQDVLRYQQSGSTVFYPIETLSNISSNPNYKMRFSSNGHYLILEYSMSVHIYDALHFLPLKTLPRSTHWDYVCAIIPHGDQLVAGTRDGTLHRLDMREYLPQWEQKGALSVFTACALSPDGLLMAATTMTSLMLWDTNTGCLIHCLHFKKLSSCDLSFSPDGSKLCLSSRNRSFVVLVSTLEELFSCEGRASFSRDGKYLAVRDFDHSVIYNTHTWQAVLELPDSLILDILHDQVLVEKLRIVPSEQSSRRVREGHYLLRLPDGVIVKDLRIKGVRTRSAAICERFLALGTNNGLILIYDTQTLMLLNQYSITDSPHLSVRNLQFSEDGAYLLENHYGLSILRRTEDWQILATNSGDPKNVWLSPKGTILWFKPPYDREDGHPTFFHTETWQPIQEEKENLSHQAFSTDLTESRLAFTEKYRTIRLYQVNRSENVNLLWSVNLEPELDVLGLDLRNLHPHSSFSPEELEILRSYGAITE